MISIYMYFIKVTNIFENSIANIQQPRESILLTLSTLDQVMKEQSKADFRE